MNRKCRCQCSELSEKELLSLMTNGCRRAVKAAARRYYESLYNTALAILSNPDSARMAAEKSMEKSFGRLDEYNADESLLFTWLRRRLIADLFNTSGSESVGDD